MEKKIKATDAKIDKLLHGLKDFPPLKDAMTEQKMASKGGGKGGG